MDADGARLVRLQVLGEKLIRVSATPDRKFADTPSLVIVPQDSVPHFDVTDTDSTVSVSTSSITDTTNGTDTLVLY